MKVPSVIKELVEHFQRNRDACHSSLYNETQLRREFLDPLFEGLGWDVQNKQGYSEAYKDVVHEDAIKADEGTKAPDYCFRIGGTRKFFVEAKKPAINIREDPSPAFQLRRYAWSAKLPLSILTDFEEFAVYDCRIRPHQTDKASAARLILLTYEEYLEKWEEIASIFSRDAVLKGSFDKYAESKRRRGTAEVDDAFLSDIEIWRKELAQNFALRNEQLTHRDLNFAVERTIDRIIFLRVCEDRGIELYGQLRDLIGQRNIYGNLFQIFRRADDRYNSGLFHFQKETGRAESPDELTPTLTLDDKPLKEIIQGLYYPDSPYAFSVLSADILGQVYEQFLGKVIRLTEGHRAKVEDKPEVKKAGGVYYTPTYIVNYIVKHTVGKLLEGKTPKEVAKLRILDPACGSGSFLIGAYQHLLDWHLNWYTQEAGVGARGVAPAGAKAARRVRRSAPKHPIYQTTGGQWRLTPAERKRILLNNIYGVDIDPQAVEVTKLSLLLKALEGETHDTLESELKLGIRALPDLGSNIKCGNSLIGPDFYDNAQMELLDDEEKYHINAFDWQSEFRQVFQADARHLWLVTFVTHNSRVSERMVTYGVEHGNALIFSKEEQLSIAKSVADTCKRYNIAVVAWNVLPDHIHMVIAAENEQVLIEHVRKIKGYSSHTYQKERKWESGQHVWAQKYHFKPISNDDALRAALQYVWNNRLKHQEQWGDDMLEVWGETEVFASLDFTLAPTLDPNKGLQPLDEFPSSPSTDKGLKPLVTTRGSSILDMLRDACVSVEEACCPRGGFDAVIGNPPWGSMLKPDEKRYLDSSYVSRTGEAESHLFFLEKGQALLAEGGLLSFITPNTWLAVVNSREIRRLLLRGSAFLEVMELSKYIFEQAPDIVPVIVLLQKTQASVGPCVVKRATFLRIHEGNFRTAFAVNNIDQNVWTDHLESAINIRATPVVRSLLAHCHARAVSLGSVAQVLYGIKTGDNSKYLSSAKTARHLKKALKTGELTRYSISWKGLYLWWNDKLAGYRKSSVEVPKIIVQYIRKLSLTRRIIAAVDASGEFYPLNNYSYITVNEEPYSLLYLAGIINSSLVNYYYANTFIDYNIKPTYLSQLPIRTINLSDKKDKAQHDKMVSLVERMLKLHKELPKAKTPDEKTRLERQITATDKQIDNLVYDLYGLTEEEIKIVEGE